jgi:PhzF family phenazine biosynthesis protein
VIRYYQVDAFTDRPFAGNPAIVVPLGSDAPTDWMQRLAAEFNLSETAFLLAEGPGRWHLRWFTPAIEVPLCGHATLASAHVLFETGAAENEARFRTQSGELIVRRMPGAGHGYSMDFPALPPEDWQPPASALAAMGLETMGLEKVVAAAASFHHPEDWYVVIELEDADAVRAVAPDMRALAREKGGGWIVTARADERAQQEFGQSDSGDVDFVSRFFAPNMGVDEDPVTGSAHCVLLPFWVSRLGRAELVAAQISERGGVVRCRLDGDRVHLAGQAVTVAQGELLFTTEP